MTLDRQSEAAQQLAESLFTGVLANDDIDPLVSLPDRIPFDLDEAAFADCLSLCRRLWEEGPSRSAFLDMVRTLGREGTLPQELREPFKHVRARFKHMRFALAVFAERHSYPPVFNIATNAVGYLQDACNNHRRDLIARYARVSGWMLRPLPWSLMVREVDRALPSSVGSFDRYRHAQFSQLPAFLGMPTISPHQFHNSRKVVSRFRAYFVTVETLLPSDTHSRIAAWLATLNGMMGDYHDGLIEKRLDGSLDYFRGQIVFPADIRERLELLAQRTSAESAAHG